MGTPLVKGRLGSLDGQFEAGSGSLGAGATQRGRIWRVRKPSSAPRSTTLATRFALPSATPPESMPVAPAPGPRPDHLIRPLGEGGVMGGAA
jgi:hypothetical protein